MQAGAVIYGLFNCAIRIYVRNEVPHGLFILYTVRFLFANLNSDSLPTRLYCHVME